MTMPNAPADTTPAATLPASSGVPPVPAPPSWPWRRAALFLVAGIAGGILHTGLFFVPALVALAVGGVKLWYEQP